MAAEFRRPKPGEVPTSGSDDELLEDPPALDQAWSLSAYAAGSRVRRWVFGGMLAGTCAAGIAGYVHVDQLRQARALEPPRYDMEPSQASADDRVLYWTSEGKARLGLTRAPPGVHTIVLPDRILRLADGSDHAQVMVEVRDGRTERLRTVVGKVTQRERGPRSPEPEARATEP